MTDQDYADKADAECREFHADLRDERRRDEVRTLRARVEELETLGPKFNTMQAASIALGMAEPGSEKAREWRQVIEGVEAEVALILKGKN